MNANLDLNRIEILPEHVIDQIKAGEVLERPASLVKELIENSIDANSSEINLHIVDNGMELVSITDNGKGMDFTNLPFAFLRHATSKLKTFEELYQLHSFGFRGEALASISSTSRLTCTSQPKNLNLEGGKIIINGGSTELLVPYKNTTSGTSIFIKDLFYNTPARLKFIKSKNSEKQALKKMIYSFILSQPNIQFTVRWDDKEKEVFKQTETIANRISQVFFGKENLHNQLIHIKNEYENYKVEIFYTKETYTSPQYRHHYLYVNGRFFQDKSLHQAVIRNLESLWPNGSSGHYVIQLSTPLDEIDVNVHPNKTQIKFLRSDIVYSILVNSLKETLRELNKNNSSFENIHTQQNLIDNSFTKDEIRNFDIGNFKLNLETNNISSSFKSTSENNNLNLISIIEDRFIFFKHNHELYVSDLIAFLSLDYSNKLYSSLEEDILPTPLLISEPFRYDFKVDYAFDILKKLGFEFDRLNKEIIVLRTLPLWIKNHHSQNLITCLLEYFQSRKVNKFEKLDFYEYAKTHLTLKHIDTNFTEELIFENLHDLHNFATKLNAERCVRILK